MTADEERRRDEILEAALSVDPAERRHLITAECGENRELQAEVERLLRLHDSMTGDFLENSPVARNPTDGAFTLGRYEVQEVIGHGGMSCVYRARDTVIGREVAIKLVTTAGFDAADGHRRFLAEVRTLGSVRQDNIVQVFDCGEFAGFPYLVMELLDGDDLAVAIRNGRCGSTEQRIAIATQLAEALHYVHEAGILHRDIKPGNVFLEKNGRVKLMDFGIARSLSPAAAQSRTFAGTLQYMSPEQLRGGSANVRTEMYSYGVVLFELFSGRSLSDGRSMAEIVHDILDCALPADELRRVGTPERIVRLVADATSRVPQDRPESFAIALERLRLLDERPIGRPWRRGTAVAAAVAVGLLVSLGAAIYSRGPGAAVSTNVSLPQQHAASLTPPGPALPEAHTATAATVSNDTRTGFIDTAAPIDQFLAKNRLQTSEIGTNPAQQLPAGELAAVPDIPVVTAPLATILPPTVITQSQDEREWQRVRTTGELAQLKSYIATYPVSPYVREAKRLAASLEWEQMSNRDDAAALLVYAQKYGELPLALQAARLAAQIQAQAAAASQVRGLLQEYASALSSKNLRVLSALREFKAEELEAISTMLAHSAKIDATLTPVGKLEFQPSVSPERDPADAMPQAAVIRAELRIRVTASNGGRSQPFQETVTVHFKRTGQTWRIAAWE